jgi:hypothetical protein
MKVNIILDAVKIYDVRDRLDIVLGQHFQVELILDEGEAIPEMWSRKDPVLDIDYEEVHVTTLQVGEAILRWMLSGAIIKDLVINVVDATSPNATTLGGTLGDPVPK